MEDSYKYVIVINIRNPRGMTRKAQKFSNDIEMFMQEYTEKRLDFYGRHPYQKWELIRLKKPIKKAKVNYVHEKNIDAIWDVNQGWITNVCQDSLAEEI